MFLLLAGKFLVDATRSHAPFWFFPLLENRHVCNQLSWGSAILACLYSGLCKASLLFEGVQPKKVNLLGLVVLVQIWAWSRLTLICLIRNVHSVELQDNVVGYPYDHRWVKAEKRYTDATTAHNGRWFRDMFDEMQPSQL